MTIHFNPFEDRMSRDIRNDLSKSLAEVIQTRTLTPAQAVADRYRSQNLQRGYIDYIDNRLASYTSTLELLDGAAQPDALVTAALLWDLELFFEVHEILEPLWIRAQGARKRLLQALIRAAGVYIYLEAGYPQRAAKISAKTLPVLRELHPMAKREMRIDRLITALEKPLVIPAPHLSLTGEDTGTV